MSTLRDFIETYRLYRHEHGRLYSARIAWGVAVWRLPF